jgi:hypothetical protein
VLRLPRRPTPAGPRTLRLVAVAVALQLVAATSVALLVEQPAPTASPAAPPRARVAPLVTAADQQAAEREAQVRRLLTARAGALLRRDQAAFLAVVDPAATELRARQAAMFDALAEVPLQSWAYVLDPARQRPPDRRMDRKYGRDRWWAPEVTLEYALTGHDEQPMQVLHHLTFVQRDGRWLLAADDDFADVGLETPRALWDRGPVVAERVDDVLVLGRPSARRLLRNIARLTAAAVPRVSGVWGADWRQAAVVLVPSNGPEMAELLGSQTDLSQIAAVATAELTSGTGASGADRVLVNPDTFGRLGQLGRQVVLTHEVAHVATRQATGSAMPMWLVEGFADYIAYRDVELPLALSARELRRDVREGRLPARFPADRDFDGSNQALAQAYEQAWLLVRLIADRHGEQQLLAFYRAVGAERDGTPQAAVEHALAMHFGTTPAALLEQWRASLQRELG